MTNHNHNVQCECKEHHQQDSGQQRSFYRKWLFSALFVFVSLYVLKPFLVAQLVNRASTYISYSLYDEAIRQYKKALFFDKKNSDIYASLAYAYQSKNDTAKAKPLYQKAIELNPNNAIALLDFGMLYFKENNYKAATGYFNSVIELGPEVSCHYYALCALVMCYEKLNYKAEEKMALQKLLCFYPNNENAKNKLKEIDDTK
jgi:Tfp pilus assembly protein PilF